MSEQLSMDNQILYKLGAIESQVSSIRDDITKVVRRLEERIEDDKIELDRSISAVRVQSEKDMAVLTARVTLNETKLTVIDEWKKAWAVRSAMVLAVFSFFWLMAGGFILDKIGTLSGG